MPLLTFFKFKLFEDYVQKRKMKHKNFVMILQVKKNSTFFNMQKLTFKLLNKTFCKIKLLIS